MVKTEFRFPSLTQSLSWRFQSPDQDQTTHVRTLYFELNLPKSVTKCNYAISDLPCGTMQEPGLNLATH